MYISLGKAMILAKKGVRHPGITASGIIHYNYYRGRISYCLLELNGVILRAPKKQNIRCKFMHFVRKTCELVGNSYDFRTRAL